MAVNDLMMKIQVLVDSGKSSAELNRLQKSLTEVAKQLNKLEKTKIEPLNQFISDLANVQKQLKTTSLDNYITSLDNLKKEFGRLGVNISNLQKLGDAFSKLGAKKTERDVSNVRSELEAIRVELQRVKTLTLTAADQKQNDYLIEQRKLLDLNSDRIRTINNELKKNRQEIINLNKELRTSGQGYAQFRENARFPSLLTLQTSLATSKEQLRLVNKEFLNAKNYSTILSNSLKDAREELSRISRGKLLSGLDVSDFTKNAGEIRKAVSSIQFLNTEIANSKKNIDYIKQQSDSQLILESNINKQREAISAVNRELLLQNQQMQSLGLKRLRALQLTEEEKKKISSIKSINAFDSDQIDIFSTSLKTAQDQLRNIKNEIEKVSAKDLTSFLKPISEQKDVVKNAQKEYERLKSAAIDAGLEAKKAALVDADALRERNRSLENANALLFGSKKGYQEQVAEIRKIKSELTLIKPFNILTSQQYQDVSKFRESVNAATVKVRELTGQIRDTKLEAQRLGRVNFIGTFEERSQNLLEVINRIKQSMTDLRNTTKFQQIRELIVGQDIAPIQIPIEIKGLTEVQNKIRSLMAERGIKSAINVEPLKAESKVLDAELKTLYRITEQYRIIDSKKASDLEKDQASVNLKELRKNYSELTGKAILEEEEVLKRINDLENSSVLTKLKSAIQAKSISNEYHQQLSGLKQLEAEGKNQLNTLGAQLKEVNQLIAAERNRARIAKETKLEEVFKTGGLSEQLNQAKKSLDDTKSGLDKAKKSYDDLRDSAKSLAEEQKKSVRSQLADLFKALRTQKSLVATDEERVRWGKAWLANLFKATQEQENLAKQTIISAKQEAERARQAAVNANFELTNRQKLLADAKDAQVVELAQLRFREAGEKASIANLKARIANTKEQIAASENEILKLESAGKLRAKAVAEEQRLLDIKIAQNKISKSEAELKKSDLSAQLAKENTEQKQKIALAKTALETIKKSLQSQIDGLDRLIADSRKENIENQIKIRQQIQGNGQIIESIRARLDASKELIRNNEQEIKNYQKGLKYYEQGIRQQISGIREKLALDQLSKTSANEERKNIQEQIRDQKELSKAYQDRLSLQRDQLKASAQLADLTIRNLEREVSALQKLSGSEVERIKNEKLLQLEQAKQQKGGYDEQVRQIDDLTRAETNRLNALERSGRLFGVFVTQHRQLQEVVRDLNQQYQETNKQIESLQSRSAIARSNLSGLAKDANLDQVKQQAKQVVEELQRLRDIRIGGEFTAQQAGLYGNLKQQLHDLNAIKREIEQTPELRTKLGGLGTRITEVRQYAEEISRLNRFMQGFQFMLSPEMLGMTAFMTVTEAVRALGQQFIETNKAAETLIRGLSAVFGQGAGEVQFERLIETANKFGLELQSLSQNYLQLTASAKGTILEGQRTEEIFNALSAAMAVLGADSVTTQRAFRSVAQMISKGQVYAEELRGQLSEALPGAIRLFAQSMGKTTDEFYAMVKAGQVGLNELIPFFQEVQKEYGNAAIASSTFEQSTNRLSNAFQLLLKNVGDMGIWTTLVAGIDGVASKLKVFADEAGRTNIVLNDVLVTLNKIKNIANIKLTSESPDRGPIDEFFDYLRNKITELRNSPVALPISTQALNVAKTIFTGIAQEISKPIEAQKELNELTREQYDLLKSLQASDPFVTVADSLEKENEFRRIANAEIRKKNANLKETNRQIALETALAWANSEAGQEAYRLDLERFRQMDSRLQASAKQLAITKQMIADEKRLLDIQQRMESTVQQIAVAQSIRQMKARGVADSITEEYNKTQAMLRVYQALAKAAELQAKLQAEPNVDAQNQLRAQLQDQLKYAEGIARTTNNQYLSLSILKQQEAIQKQIADQERKRIDLTNVQNKAIASTIRDQELALNKVTNAGLDYVNKIRLAISAHQQINSLLQTQEALNIRNAAAAKQTELNYKEAKTQAEANAKAIEQSQIEQGKFLTPEYEVALKKRESAARALAAAEDAYAQMSKTNNEQAIQELRKIVEENLNVAKTSYVEAGYAFGLTKVKELQDAMTGYEKKVNDVNIAQQKLSLEGILKASTPEEIKKWFNELNKKIQEQIAIRNQATQATKENSSADQAQLELAQRAQDEINRLLKERTEALEAYRAGVATGALPEIVLPVSADTTQAESTVTDLVHKIESNPVTLTVNVKYNDPGYSAKAPGKQIGGLIPGYGGGDRLHYLLEPGEFVLRKEAARAIGLQQLAQMNRLGGGRRNSLENLAIPGMANGGMVTGSPIVINLPSGKPIHLSGSREAANQLANLLSRTSRAL